MRGCGSGGVRRVESEAFPVMVCAIDPTGTRRTVVSGMPWQMTSLMEVQQDLGKPQ